MGRWGAEPSNVDVVRFFGPYPYRSPWGTNTPEEQVAALTRLRQVIELQGGVLIADRIAQRYDHTGYPGGLTYAGHPLAGAAGVASIGIFERDGILDHVRSVGADVLGKGLRDLATRHPSVGEVRGLGFFLALDLVRDPRTREPLIPFAAAGAAAEPMAKVSAAAKAHGLWPFNVGNRFQIAPPLTTMADELRVGLEIVDEVLKVADEYMNSRQWAPRGARGAAVSSRRRLAVPGTPPMRRAGWRSPIAWPCG